MESRCFTRSSPRRRSSTSASRTLTRSAAGAGEVLADVVGADGQLAVTAVDQHREAHGGGPAEVGERVEGRPDGAPGEEHVVDEDDDLAVDAAGRASRSCASARVGCVRRSSRYIVTSSSPTATGAPRPLAMRSRDALGRAGTPRVWRPSRTRSAAPLLRSRISWEMRVRARAMSPGSSTDASEGAGRHRGPDLLLRLTGRLVKGCRLRVCPSVCCAQTLPAVTGVLSGATGTSPVQRQELNMSVGYSAAYWRGITPWKKAESPGSCLPSTSCSSCEEKDCGPHLGPRASTSGAAPASAPSGSSSEAGTRSGSTTSGRPSTSPYAARLADTRFVIGDVRHLVHSGIGSDFSLVLDVGCFQGLEQGRPDPGGGAASTELAAPDATVLIADDWPARFPAAPEAAPCRTTSSGPTEAGP